MKGNNMPLVTAIIPSYNHERYVEQAIKGIINQTYKNIQFIVVDDASKDNSASIIKKLADKYNFTFIQHSSNKGLSKTLSECLKISKGKYICFCASDDIYFRDKIQKQVEFMERHPEYSMCYGKVIKIDSFGNKISKKMKKTKSGFIFEDLIMDFFIPAVTVMARKEILDKVGLFDESLFIEDLDMILRIAYKYKIGYLDEYLAYYRIHETNSHKQVVKMYESEKRILNKWKNEKNFHKYINRYKIRWFNILSPVDKMLAKKYLKTALLNIYRLEAIVGLFKYLFVKEKRK